ncbi:hypothetical protein [Desulforhopalus sp. IMCC35007]|uniref:hypothetical protein n=1 Tax=Desulforhopalus sp. IMCC35007 TaxID=2569543 RepID=UPI0010AE6DC7|nr:hypothetical protein [Desulforhopalus sp. IMCC35007]TKB11587.1 hypothetical protein FCL48_01945 [Desulforhopalus sp. IMCC35007]
MKNLKNSRAKDAGSSKSNWREKYLAKILSATVVILLSSPLGAMAMVEQFVLDFNDSHIRGYQGEGATIFLKKSLKEQYPWLNLSRLELHNVVLVAKSKKGRGGAELRVGNWVTPMAEVDGNPRRFHNSDRSSFDRIRLWNPSKNSQGEWQIGLHGNLIVRKVVLMVENHSPRDYQKRGRGKSW